MADRRIVVNGRAAEKYFDRIAIDRKLYLSAKVSKILTLSSKCQDRVIRILGSTECAAKH